MWHFNRYRHFILSFLYKSAPCKTALYSRRDILTDRVWFRALTGKHKHLMLTRAAVWRTKHLCQPHSRCPLAVLGTAKGQTITFGVVGWDWGKVDVCICMFSMCCKCIKNKHPHMYEFYRVIIIWHHNYSPHVSRACDYSCRTLVLVLPTSNMLNHSMENEILQ